MIGVSGDADAVAFHVENRPIDLRREEIHLWLCHWDESGEVPAYGLEWLSDDEQRQLQKFVFARDRHRYLKTRLLAREVLSHCLGCSPRDLHFKADVNGRPQLVNPPSHLSGQLDFNISHTAGLIVLAVRYGAPVGVDVECLSRAVNVERMSRLFSKSEIETLSSLRPEQQASHFLDLWTLKESYIKARGLGLRIPLHRFGFDCASQDTVTLYFDEDFGDLPQNWYLWQFHLQERHTLAVCTARESGQCLKLIAHEIEPFKWYRDVALTPRRQSFPATAS